MGRIRRLLLLLAVLALFAAACGDDETTTTGDDGDDCEMMDHLGDGSLGTITVEPGAEVQIRSLNALTGDVALFGLPIHRSIEIAVDDYGDIHCFSVSLGQGLDDLCSGDGGQAAAQTIVANEQIAGVVGTSCSAAAVAAAPLTSEAGIVMISGGNTSPALTSDLAGTAGDNYNEGYYRTAHNDLYQGRGDGSVRVQRTRSDHRCGNPRRRPLHPGPRSSVRRCLRGDRGGDHQVSPA